MRGLGAYTMITSILMFIVSIASAVEGNFAYQGDHTVVSAVRYETVYTPSEIGKQRLQELQTDGYSCQAKLQFVQCKKLFDAPTDIPQNIVQAHPSVLNVHFEAVQSMDLIAQGDDIALYEAVQNAIVDGKKYEQVKYLERPDLVKATVGDPNDSQNYHSFIVNSDSVSVLDSIHLTESKWVFTTYHVEFFLPKK